MSPEAAGIVGIFALLLLFLIRVPIAFAMMLVGLTGFAYLADVDPALSILSRPDIYISATSSSGATDHPPRAIASRSGAFG